MVTLIIHTWKAVKTLVHGFRDPELRGLWTFSVVVLLSGMVFYHFQEDLRWLDALYLAFCTLTTIGYGDFVPHTDIGKVFTMVYALSGIGLFFTFINKFSEATHKRRKKHQSTKF